MGAIRHSSTSSTGDFDWSGINFGRFSSLNATAYNSAILAGRGHTINSTAIRNAIVSGSSHTINSGAKNSGILGGVSGVINANVIRVAIIGGNGVVADKDDYAYAQNLEVQGGIAQYDAVRTLTADTEFAHKKYVDDASLSQYDTVQTTTATQTDIGTLAVASNSLVHFTAMVSGVESATGDALVMKVEGAIKNVAGTTSVIDSVTATRVAEDAGAATWDVTVEADDAADQLEIKVTGEASHTIEWSSRLIYNTNSF
jgi:hypothetical protein